jgi:hypothetical protein
MMKQISLEDKKQNIPKYNSKKDVSPLLKKCGFTINVNNTFYRLNSRLNWFKLCEHLRPNCRCTTCATGIYICEHRRRREDCKDCGGKNVCEHHNIKIYCKQCGSTGLCQHGKRKSHCKQCGGTIWCSHDKLKTNCLECGGGSLCEHKKVRAICKDCKGSAFCEHDRIRYDCKDCKGNGICEHNHLRRTCKKCKGSAICEHNHVKYNCKECGKPRKKCPHDRRVERCVDCNGSQVCVAHTETDCGNLGQKRYEKHCARCYIFLFPDKPISRYYCTKEQAVYEFIKKTYPDFDVTKNKQINGGCSKRRPDIVFDFGSHVVIIEIDEHRHRHKRYSCETKRMFQIMQDTGCRPIIFVRFNPDGYTNKRGTSIKSCWDHTSKGLPRIKPSKKAEWEHRLNTLKTLLDDLINNEPTKEFTVHQLFYSHKGDDNEVNNDDEEDYDSESESETEHDSQEETTS